MSFTSWLRDLRSVHARACKPRQHKSHRVAPRRPHLEALEERCLLSFSPAVNYSGVANATTLVAADFNNDTRLDLAVANNGNHLSVLLGNPDGTFQPAADSAIESMPSSLAVGDFDGDGNLDVVSPAAYGASLLRGNGDGTFQTSGFTAVGSSVSSVAVGDFDSDGLLDLALAGYDVINGEYGNYYTPCAHVLLGDGHGAFAALSTTPLSDFDGWYLHAAVADFNGDGVPDFAVAIPDNNAVCVLLNDGSGSLQAPTAFGVGNYPIAVAAADVDGDGDIDLVTANSSGNNASVLRNDGSGGFGPSNTMPPAIAPNRFNWRTSTTTVTSTLSPRMPIAMTRPCCSA